MFKKKVLLFTPIMFEILITPPDIFVVLFCFIFSPESRSNSYETTRDRVP